MRKQRKNISCPICEKKYSDMEAARNHIQRKHPESHLSPRLKGTSLPSDSFDPTTAAADANQEMGELNGADVGQSSETGPIVLRLSYSLSGGSPWRILSDGQWRTFHHPGVPGTGPSGIDVERIQGLPGKTETISNVIINELASSVRQTQAIILSPTRETARATYTLISSAAASAFITTHLSVGGTNVHEDRQRLKERPHIVVGTIGRIFAMLERKTIIPGDIRFLCIDGIQHLLCAGLENEFAEFCEQLPKDIEVVFLSTKSRYKTSHDLGKLFTHKPLHFLVKEDPAPEPGALLHDPEPVGVGPDQDEDTTRSAVRLDTNNIRPDYTWFCCEVGECSSKFPTKDDLRSHVRFFHWRTTSKPGGNATVAGDDVPYSDKAFGRTEVVMYLCGLCERYPPFKSSWEFGRHLKRMHLESKNVAVSKVGLATHSASDGPYMDTYLVHRSDGTAESSESESMQDHDCKDSGSGSSDDGQN